MWGQSQPETSPSAATLDKHRRLFWLPRSLVAGGTGQAGLGKGGGIGKGNLGALRVESSDLGS